MPDELEMRLAAVPASARQMRNAAAAVAAAVGLAQDMVYDVRLAVSEAVTNSVRHGSVAGADIVMEVLSAPGWVRITIRDGGPEAGTEIDHGLGLGLPIMTAVANDLKFDRAASGTVVTMTFSAPGRGETAAGPVRPNSCGSTGNR
jgi:anti-sigma regulatory factor (Ser/Thr protein kinase)